MQRRMSGEKGSVDIDSLTDEFPDPSRVSRYYGVIQSRV